MFICESCRKQQPAHVAARPVVTVVRNRSYVDAETGEEIGFGHEIVKQIRACSPCEEMWSMSGPKVEQL